MWDVYGEPRGPKATWKHSQVCLLPTTMCLLVWFGWARLLSFFGVCWFVCLLGQVRFCLFFVSFFFFVRFDTGGMCI